MVAPIAEWLFVPDTPDSQTITDATGRGLHGTRGSDNTVQTTDGTWTATGLALNGSQYGRVPQAVLGTAINGTSYLVIAIAKQNSTSGNQQIIARDNGGQSNTAQFQLRFAAGKVSFNERGGTTSEMLDDTTAVPAGQYVMALGRVRSDMAVLRKNGIQIAAAPVTVTAGDIFSDLTFGSRGPASSYNERLNGEIVYAAIYGDVPDDHIATVEQRARAIATAKGITLP